MAKKTTEEKIREIDGSFVDEAYLATPEQLKEKLLQLATYKEELEKTRSEDEDLKTKKGIYDTAKETYTEPLKAIGLKQKLIVEIMSARGKA